MRSPRALKDDFHEPDVTIGLALDRMVALYCPTITYNPVTDPFGEKANHYKIERSPGDTFIYECVFDPDTGFPTPSLSPDSIIIATAGAYWSDDYCYPGPRAGYAVFFGPGNTLNIHGAPLPKLDGRRMSLQRGELAAAVAALKAVLMILHRGGILLGGKRLQSVIIKTHSEDLTRAGAVTERYRVFEWMRMGWVGCGPSIVRDSDLWEEFLRLLWDIEDLWGVRVSFWWVPGDWNLVAKKDAWNGVMVPPPYVPRRA